jgi:beta-lactam-binding protein with PASTA domain
VPRSVVQRGGRVLADNGLCRETKSVWFFSGQEPREADCKPNEVEVPRVIGSTLAEAKQRLAAQPLRHDVIYKPATPGQRLDVVLGQIPAKGTLSAHDTVMLVLARPRHGVLPSVVGLPVDRAIRKLERLKLHPAVVGGPGGRVVRQAPHGRIATAPGMEVKLVVSRG